MKLGVLKHQGSHLPCNRLVFKNKIIKPGAITVPYPTFPSLLQSTPFRTSAPFGVCIVGLSEIKLSPSVEKLNRFSSFLQKCKPNS